MTSNDSLNQVYSNDVANGVLTAGGDGSGSGTSTLGDETSSSAATSWEPIVLIIFWLIFLALTASIVYSVHNEPKKQRTADQKETTVDPEQPQGPSSNRREVNTANSPSNIPMMLTVLATIIALAFSIVPHASCNYLDVSETTGGGDFLNIGLWSAAYEYNPSTGEGGDDVCYSTRSVPWFEVDRHMVVARVSGVISTTLGGLVLLFLTYIAFFGTSSVKPIWIRSLCVPLSLSFVFQLVTLAIQETGVCASEEACEFEVAGYCAVTAALYWLLATFAVTVVPLQ